MGWCHCLSRKRGQLQARLRDRLTMVQAPAPWVPVQVKSEPTPGWLLTERKCCRVPVQDFVGVVPFLFRTGTIPAARMLASARRLI